MALRVLPIWIGGGGGLQQAARGGFGAASSLISVKSWGRSNTQTLSSLSTAKPVTPPIFHLFGRGLGQSGSNLNFGAVGSCAASTAHKTNKPKPANPANAHLHPLLFMSPSF